MREEFNEETQIELEKAIDIELKKDIDEVKEALKEVSGGKEYRTFDYIEPDVVEKLCEKHDMEVLPQFKEAMNNPYAIAKYINLKLECDQLCTEVSSDLNKFLDKTKLDWVVHRDLSNEITFAKTMDGNDVIPPHIVIKYRKDDLTDKIIYGIKSDTWVWYISKDNLKALLEGGIIKQETVTSELKPTIKSLSDTEIVINLGDKFTITCKQS